MLACAKNEFLQKGFKDASLRVIAKEAGTRRGLFGAIVRPAADSLLDVLGRKQAIGWRLNAE